MSKILITGGAGFIGSNIINKIVIGSNTIIGAGSTVIKNISSNQIYAGSPAKKIKRSK